MPDTGWAYIKDDDGYRYEARAMKPDTIERDIATPRLRTAILAMVTLVVFIMWLIDIIDNSPAETVKAVLI